MSLLCAFNDFLLCGVFLFLVWVDGVFVAVLFFVVFVVFCMLWCFVCVFVCCVFV